MPAINKTKASSDRIKMKIRKGDTVQIISGKEKGKTGEVIQTLPYENRVVVQGINQRTKHLKPTQEGESGRIETKETSLHASNVMIYSTNKKVASKVEILIDKDGSKKVPVMLHRALFGSLERFIGILIENYSGKLPFWISPSQIMVIPVSEDFNDYSVEVNKKLIASGLNSEVDLKNHNLNYKIREHSLSKVPILLICGKKEVDSNSVTIRQLDSTKQENMELKKFINHYQALNKAPSL